MDFHPRSTAGNPMTIRWTLTYHLPWRLRCRPRRDDGESDADEVDEWVLMDPKPAAFTRRPPLRVVQNPTGTQPPPRMITLCADTAPNDVCNTLACRSLESSKRSTVS